MNTIKSLLLTVLVTLSPSGPLFAQLNVQNSSGTELMRVTDDGKVGIGVSVPLSTLSVNGNVMIGSNYANMSGLADGLAVEGQLFVGPDLSMDITSQVVITETQYTPSFMSTL